MRPLALALLARTNADGPIKTPWTAKAYRNSIVQFVRWLDRHDFTGDLQDVTVGHLYGFGGGCSEDTERNLRGLFRATISAGIDDRVSDAVAAQLDGLGVAQRSISQPLLPYSSSEYVRLVDVCRGLIARWEGSRSLAQPPADVILAFRIIMGFELGMPADSLTKVVLSGIRWQGEHEVKIEFTKPRADGPQSLTFNQRGPWAGPSLLRRWLRASGPMRMHAGAHAEHLWIWVDSVGRVRPALFAEYEWRATRLALLREHDIRGDDGRPLRLDMRRLRKTWIARKTKFWHGAVTVDPNHSAQVEGDYYAAPAANSDEVDATIEDAQNDLQRRAEQLALVLASDDELADHIDGPEGARERLQLGQPNQHQWDMFAAACRNPFDSPFTAKGSVCTAAVWSCLVCPLAVITPAKLPALLRLRDFLQARSAEVADRDWLIAYAPAWVQLTTRILPRFDDAMLATARTAVENDLDLPLPADPLWSS